jgi:hypothetical protein
VAASTAAVRSGAGSVIGRLLICYAALLLAAASARANGPAVSAPNGSATVDGGEFGYEEWLEATASYAMPLGHAFGTTIEAGGGKIKNEPAAEGTLRLFTRDPSQYLLGLYTWYDYSDSFKDLRTAGELELYLDRFTLSGLAGYENMDVVTTEGGSRVLNSDNGHFFGVADLTYYATDNFKITAGYRYVYEVSLASLSAEYLLQGLGAPVSLFATTHIGNDTYQRTIGGLKVYLGAAPSKALIDRHRKDLVDIVP